MIRFLYDRQAITLEDAPADLTVLDWLRLQAGRTGTKEGCASGDCGACTAVMGVPVDTATGLPSHPVAGHSAGTRLDYRPFNTCITLVGALHGRQLLTVEHLADGDTLHPAQAAMVNHHGSQCGFCTPGFVMSLFALWHASGHPELAARTRIEHALGGNLCRCTGYRPIIDAAHELLARPPDDRFARDADATLGALAALADGAPDVMTASVAAPVSTTMPAPVPAMPSTGYLRPDSLDALLVLRRRHPGAPLVGGSTDLALEITQKLARIDTVIAVGGVAELDAIEVVGTDVTIGAAVSVARLQAFFAVHLPSVGEYLLRFAAEQVRGQATLGGNLGTASPIGDLPPVLLALDAEIVLQNADARRALPLADFFEDYRQSALADDEIIVAVRFSLPMPGDGLVVAYKVSKRADDDISTVAAVFRLDIDAASGRVDRARLAFGGMAAIPRRSHTAEAALTGEPFDDTAVTRAIAAIRSDFSPMSDARASAGYRREVAGNLLLRCLLEWQVQARSTPTPTPTPMTGSVSGPVTIASLLANAEGSDHGRT